MTTPRPYDYETDIDQLLSVWQRLESFGVITRDEHVHAIERMNTKSETARRLLPAPEAVQGVPV